MKQYRFEINREENKNMLIVWSLEGHFCDGEIKNTAVEFNSDQELVNALNLIVNDLGI